MTLHWWMHWFWVTVVAVLAVLASHGWCAPQSNHPQPPAGHEIEPFGDYHAEPNEQYMALLSDLHDPPTGHDYYGVDQEDTFPGDNLFPLNQKVVIGHVAGDFSTTYMPVIHAIASQQPRLDPPTPHDQVVLVTDSAKTPSSIRLGKSVDETAAAATLIPSMPIQYKNRNPFINEEMHSGRNVPAVVPVSAAQPTESSTPEDHPSQSYTSTTEVPAMEEKVAHSGEEGVEELHPSVAPAAPDHEETIKSTPETNESTPRIVPTASTDGLGQTEEAKVKEAAEPTKETVVLNGGTHPIPPWIPDERQEDADSEEEERELEQIDRVTNALVEEESVDEGEAITRGRMQPDEGLGTPSIIAIVVGFVGIIGIAGAAAGFLLYKRSLLNKPQTLNDKISNPDYSSYIDDTLRDNSEEMYSLDNDSFLNSLEAMTIQNYWTESVKHTKL